LNRSSVSSAFFTFENYKTKSSASNRKFIEISNAFVIRNLLHRHIFAQSIFCDLPFVYSHDLAAFLRIVVSLFLNQIGALSLL